MGEWSLDPTWSGVIWSGVSDTALGTFTTSTSSGAMTGVAGPPPPSPPRAAPRGAAAESAAEIGAGGDGDEVALRVLVLECHGCSLRSSGKVRLHRRNHILVRHADGQDDVLGLRGFASDRVALMVSMGICWLRRTRRPRQPAAAPG